MRIYKEIWGLGFGGLGIGSSNVLRLRAWGFTLRV